MSSGTACCAPDPRCWDGTAWACDLLPHRAGLASVLTFDALADGRR